MTMLRGMYCVVSVMCLLSISTAVADNNTPQREVNCTAVLIEAAAKRDSEVSECVFFLLYRKVKFVLISIEFLAFCCVFAHFVVSNRG